VARMHRVLTVTLIVSGSRRRRHRRAAGDWPDRCVAPEARRWAVASALAPFVLTARCPPIAKICYVLKNAENPPHFYTGVTAALRERLDAHNAGRCHHTPKHRPWAVDVLVKFADERRALKFERYLKSGSGVEFARRHLR